MKDIDFDELDRAVSSVLGQKVEPKSEDVPTTSISEPQKSTDNPVTSSNLSDGRPAPVAPPRPVSAPGGPLAAKRRGRFMDVMHPSSDVGSPKPSSFPSRATRSLQPLSPVSPEPVETQTVEPTAQVDEAQSLIGAEPAPVDTEHLLEAHYDDTNNDNQPETSRTPLTQDDQEPTDVTVADTALNEPESSSTAPEVGVSDDAQPETENVDEPAASQEPEPTSLTSTVPQTSPFLADAHVEKRPLGGAPSDATAEPVDTTVGHDLQSAPSVPLPRELQPDVVEAESTEEPEVDPTGPGSKPFATNVDPAPEPQDDGRVEGHPLFDTQTYHEPIIPVHGSSSVPTWLKWLLGLLVCLLVGAGVGYFLFTAGL